jgi:hypothetical protein
VAGGTLQDISIILRKGISSLNQNIIQNTKFHLCKKQVYVFYAYSFDENRCIMTLRQIHFIIISGSPVYIPTISKKRGWRNSSGHKYYLTERNILIKSKFELDTGIEQLAREFHLSCESIKK